MYLDHYNLKLQPFQTSSDPKFLWQGEKHKEALAILKYGILDNKGFLVLTGEIGTGKTTIINVLKESLEKSVVVASISDPRLDLIDFYNLISKEYKFNRKFNNKGDFLEYFKEYLLILHDLKVKALLIIDEAQRITEDMLEEIRLISNLELADTKLINIFFVGQPEFKKILMSDRNRPLRQRIALNYNIKPLDENETKAYITHRLKVAGTNQNIFSADAIKTIHHLAKGYPRLINIVCDHVLLTGFAKGKKTISKTIVKECSDELQVPLGEIKDFDDIELSGNKTFNLPVRKILVVLVLVSLCCGLVFMYYKKDLYWPKVSEKMRSIIKIVEVEKNQKVEKKEPGKKEARSGQLQGLLKQYPQIENPTRITFDNNSTLLSIEALKKLNRIAAMLSQEFSLNVFIFSQENSLQHKPADKQLNDFRMEIVNAYLIDKGARPNQIEIQTQAKSKIIKKIKPERTKDWIMLQFKLD